MYVRIVDRDVVRVEHWYQPSVRCSLDVVLAPKGVSVPGRPTCPVIRASEIRHRELSVPCTCWEIPMPQKMILRSAFAYSERWFGFYRIDPADFRHLFRRERSHVLLQVFDAFGEVLDVVFVRQALFDDCVHIAFRRATSDPPLN